MKKFQEQGTLKAFSECFEHAKLDGLDREFYDLDERLSALRIKYIRAQPDLFVGK